MRMPRRIPTFLLLATFLACSPGEERRPVRIATTPDVAGTGIVQMLAERFSDESKVQVKVIVTERQLVPVLVSEGRVGVVLTTDPALRDALQRAELVSLTDSVAYDDYLLVGPKTDPARAGKAKTAGEALRRIARRDRAFCSPMDEPELRQREEMLWNASPADPGDNRRYRDCHGAALDVLQETSHRNGYTLTDRSTFERRGRDVHLVPLLQGTPLLHNELMVVLARSPERRTNAEWFAQWLMSYRGRELIEQYRFDGERRYFVRER